MVLPIGWCGAWCIILDIVLGMSCQWDTISVVCMPGVGMHV